MNMSNIYKDHCLSYLKAGYSVIPDGYMKKSPLIRGWNQYSTRFPSQGEVTNWATTFQKSNIALCLGEASGVVAIDVDTEDPKELALIRSLLPPSPCEKIGMKGFTRFYRFKGDKTTVLKNANNEVILELLSTGKKTTIPPSMHTSGKPYRWVDKTLLEVHRDSLPILPAHLLPTLEAELQNAKAFSVSIEKRKGGRHNFLGALASQMIADRIDVTAATLRLIEADAKNHEKPLFTDPTENQNTNAFVNALTFYNDFFKSINNKRLSEGLAPELPLPSSNLITVPKANTSRKELVSLPIPTGALKDVYDYILAKSYVEQPVFALSASLSLIGTLASRKFTFQGATPNTYILNIADSGSGKDSCQQAVKEILGTLKAESLLGATSYPSEASITVNLEAHPTRLDIIDEASSFLQIAASGGSAYQVGIGDTLCELYSCSNSHYLGKVLATNMGERTGACHRPHLNLLCSTTYKGISESLTRATLEKGLFARFLTFFGENNKEGKRVIKQPRLKANIKEVLTEIYHFENPLFAGDNKLAMPAYELECTDEANALLDKYHRTFDLMRIKSDGSNVARPVIARLYQQMMKIALIAAVSDKELGSLPVVKGSHVEFAYGVIQFFYQAIEGFIEQNLFDSKRGKEVNRVLRVISDRGVEGISSAELTKETKSLTIRDRQEIIRDLIASRQIEMIPTKDPQIVLFRRLIREND